MAPQPQREDTWRVTVELEGKDLGIFDKKDGGEVDSDENKYRPGGMQPEISLGGAVTLGEITTSRYYDAARDHPLFAFLHGNVGAGQGKIGIQPLDFHGNPRGDPVTYLGTLRTFTPFNVDNESQDAAQMELVWTIYDLAP